MEEAALETMKKQRKIYKVVKKLIRRDRKRAGRVWSHNCYFVDKIGEALKKNRTHIFIHVPERFALAPLFLTHAEDTNLIMEVLQQRKKELEYATRTLDLADELNELKLTKTAEEYNEKRQEVSNKMTAILAERNAEWLAIVINLKNTIKKDTNKEMSEEEEVYYARRICNISVVLAYMIPPQFIPKKGHLAEISGKNIYIVALGDYTRKHGKNPIWNGEELKPLPEWKKDEPEHDMWTFRIMPMQ